MSDTTPAEEDTTYVCGVLNGKVVNFPERLTRDYLVRFFGVDARSTITVVQPGKVGATLDSESLIIEPHTVVNAVVTDSA